MHEDTLNCSLPELLWTSADKYPDSPALGFAGESTYTYQELWQKVLEEAAVLKESGIGTGDRVAILSTNMPEWPVAYFGILITGAVCVPLLPDFTAAEVSNIIEHSGTKAIYVSDSLRSRLDEIKADAGLKTWRIEELFSRNESRAVHADRANLPSPEDLAAIIYTSGTTGRSKGVMLTHGNICSNVRMGKSLQHVDNTDRFLSVLPLSHTLENTVGLLISLSSGACTHYLRKPPTAPVLLPALEEIRPTFMLTVPLIIEKIYKAKVYPSLTKGRVLSTLYKWKPARRFLHRLAGQKLMQTFGGSLKFFGIGGAKLDGNVEQFLLDAGFPYAIGYGLTETAPLLAGAVPGKTRLGSTGPAVEGVELIINEPDADGQGEVWARGPNVMKGYYKEPGLTAEVLTEDGWFRTGDLGSFDENGNLFIRGRSKSLILGSSGENIYPEDIESVINSFRHVVESLVVQKSGKLVALVHFNSEEIDQKYRHLRETVHDHVEHMLDQLQSELLSHVNARVNKFSRLQLVMVQHEPFQRTATQKIKRFLYSREDSGLT